MDWSLRKMRAKQIEKELSGFSRLTCPQIGWVKTIRETLGMNTRQLGSRCNVTSERIIKIEADEVEGRTTVATLEKIAEAMNCKLVYAFVPNSEMIEFIEKTAEEKARTQLMQTAHHMALEDQKVSVESMKDQIEILKGEILKNNVNLHGFTPVVSSRLNSRVQAALAPNLLSPAAQCIF
jgi:predicted DNA-binding mobile mystery protein A